MLHLNDASNVKMIYVLVCDLLSSAVVYHNQTEPISFKINWDNIWFHFEPISFVDKYVDYWTSRTKSSNKMQRL